MFIPDDDDKVGAGTTEGGDGTPDNEPINSETEENHDKIDKPDSSEAASAETEKTETGEDETGKKQPGQDKKRSDFVPYSRFKEVNASYRQEVERRAKLEARLENAEALLQKLQSAPATSSLDENQKKVADYYVHPVIAPLQKELKELKDEVLANKEAIKLDKKLEELNLRYPLIKNVPFAREVLENRYIMDSKSDLDETAQQLNDYFAQMKKETINTYLAGKKKDATHKGATPPGSPASSQPKPLPKNASLEERMAVAERGIKESFKK